MTDQLVQDEPTDATMKRIALGLIAEAPPAPLLADMHPAGDSLDADNRDADIIDDIGVAARGSGSRGSGSRGRALVRRGGLPLAIAAAVLVLVGLVALRPFTGTDQTVSTSELADQPDSSDGQATDPSISPPPAYPNYPAFGSPLAMPTTPAGQLGPLTTPGPAAPGLFAVMHGSTPGELPVFDEPATNAEPRMLIDRNPVSGVETPVRLVSPIAPGRPLVLRVVEGAVGDQFIRVQAPVRPHRQAVWVSTELLTFYNTEVRIEVDVAIPGQLEVYRGDELLITSPIVYGRSGRETALHETYVEQLMPGPDATPPGFGGDLFGNWLLSIASFSEVLAEFGGEGYLPAQAIHGTANPELMGQAVSSGGIRVTNETMDEIVAIDGLIGAPVTLFDSSNSQASSEVVQERSWTAASTVDIGTDTAVDLIYGYD